MTDAKHTPGPWDFGPGYTPGATTFDLYGPGGREVITSASYENMWLSAYDADTNAANARLIASAPDLLEALGSLYALADGQKSYPAGSYGEGVMAHAEAAIRKATGEAA